MTELQKWGWERCACWKPVRKEPVKELLLQKGKVSEPVRA